MSLFRSPPSADSRPVLAWRWLTRLALLLALLPAPAIQAAPAAHPINHQDTPPGDTLAIEASQPGASIVTPTALERIWQQIEAAHNIGDTAALQGLIQELAQYDLVAALPLAQELIPPTPRPVPTPVGPIDREQEAAQAAAEEAARAEAQRQEEISRALAEKPTPADDEKWATPSGAGDPQHPAATLTVGDSCTYATVQAAVNAAVSGDTIRVQAKTFTGSSATVNINGKALTLSGGWNNTCTTQGATKTTLDATGASDSVIEVYGGAGPLTVTIDNFWLTGGENDADFGGAIEIDGQFTVTAQRTIIRDNDSNMGGGVTMSSGTTLNLEDGSWLAFNNALAGDGGGVYCSGGTVSVSSDASVGVFILGPWPNTASGNGGGLYLDDCDAFLVSNAYTYATILGNSAVNGGGIYATNNSYVNLRGSNAMIRYNSATYGGGVYLAGGSDLYVDNGAITDNSASASGGGVYATGDGALVDMGLNPAVACSGHCTTLRANTANSYGGGVLVTSGADLDLSSVYVEENSGSLGSAFYARDDAVVTLHNVMATDNTATSNYTLRLLNASGAPTAVIGNSTFAGNSGQSASFGADTGTRLDGDALVFWGNSDTSLVAGSGDVTIDCSIVQHDFPGSNNTVSDPDFRDPAGGDYHLAHTSPAIDLCSEGSTRDVDWDTRPYDVAGVGYLLEATAQVTPEQRQVGADHGVRITYDELGGRRLDETVSGTLLARDYGSFAWLALGDEQFALLQASDLPFAIEEGFGLIQFDIWRFDPLRDGMPALPAGLGESATNRRGQGLSLVQLYAPADDQDMEALHAAGVVLQHYPYNAFLLWTDPRGLARLDDQPNVRWIGPFVAAFRLSARLAQAAGEAGQEGLPHVQALLLDDGYLADVEALIQAAGGVIRSRAARHVPGEAMAMETWEFSLPAGLLDTLVHQPQLLASDIVGKSDIDDERSTQIVADNAPGGEPETGYTTWLNETGYRGRTVTVAIVDTGVDWDHPDLNVASGTDYGGYSEPNEPGSDGAPDVNGDSLGSGHGTHVAGIVAGDGGSATADPDGFVYGLGMAPGATLHAMDAIAEDNANPSVTVRVRDAAANADLSNNSWNVGNPAGYSLNASDQDDWVLDADRTNVNVRDFFLTVFSAGNAGGACGAGPCASSITEPKEAKNILTVANSLSRRSNIGGGLTGDITSLAGSSSRGPAFDGRLLPNLTAPGTNIISTENRVVTAGGATNLSCSFSPGNSTQHSYCSGTSMSTPHVTGAAALFFEFWRLRHNGADPYPETVKASLINATDNMAGGDNGWGAALGNRPDNHQGWGRLNIDRVLNPTVAVQYYQNPLLLTSTGGIWERTVRANSGGQPLRISLVWQDAPGAANANPARVNNLDLRVTSAGGTLWRGNVFSGGWSTTGGSADTLNNVENVFIQTPSSSAYTIRVTATTLNGDAYYYNGDATDQHFSLVCWNCEEILDGTYDAGADEATAFVGIDGAACAYPTIVSAIAAAAPGATLYIGPGTYPERLGTIDKDLTLTAATADCSVEASGGVTIDANDAAATYGGVAEVAGNRTVTFKGLDLIDGSASYGGLLYVAANGHVVLDSTDLRAGTASVAGGAMRLFQGATAELINGSRLYGSLTTGPGDGGGVAVYQGTLTLRGDSRVGEGFTGNQAADLGGGVFLDGGLLQMFDSSRVWCNSAVANGGGVYAQGGADVVLNDGARIGWTTSSAANSAVDGGGVFLTGAGSSLTLNDDSGVQFNSASEDGGGIYVTGGASVVIDSATVDHNQAVRFGGGIRIGSDTSVTVQNGSTIDSNEVTSGYGGGGGIYGSANYAAVTIDASQVNNNVSANSSGGIGLVGANNTLNLTGGAAISGNQAQTGFGGGLRVAGGSVIIDDAAIQSNTAATSGGGIHLDAGTVLATDADIRFNTATAGSGGGIYHNGGALTLRASNKTTYVADNTAGANGGGIYDSSGATLTLRTTGNYSLRLNTNQAGASGGGIFATDGTEVNAEGWIQAIGNVAADDGGALYLNNGATARLDDDPAGAAVEMRLNIATSGHGGGIYALNSPVVELDGGQIGSSGSGNRALAGSGGGIYLDNSDLWVDNTKIVGNQAGNDGGGIAAVNTSSVTFASSLGAMNGLARPGDETMRAPAAVPCNPNLLAADTYCMEVRDNSAADSGGGIFFQGESTGSIVRTAFVANTAAIGSALELYDSTVSLQNSIVRDHIANSSTIHVFNEGGSGPTSTFDAVLNTIVNNQHYGVFYTDTTGGTFANNIVWGNTSLGVITGGSVATAATCNDTQDSVLLGAGNISSDPRFMATPRGAFHLQPGSPALDACATGSGSDLDNISRPRGVRYDMGAFELWCAHGVTDVDGSGKTDIVDVARVAGDFLDAGYLPQHDINCDGAVTVTDIQAVASAWAP